MRLAHLGFVVPDMERGIRRFVSEGAEVIIAPTDDPLQRVSCCLLRCDGAADIELVAPLVSGDSPVESRLRRGGGLDHVCYDTDDLAAALVIEEDRGSLVVCPPTFAVTFGRDIAFVQRRSGLIVEFMAEIGRDSGAEIGRDSGAEIGRDSGAEIGRDSGAEIGRDSGAEIGRDSGAEIGRDSGAEIGRDSGAEIGRDSGAEIGRDSERPRT